MEVSGSNCKAASFNCNFSKAPLQALIFDSVYDAYKGVIVFCRIREGSVKPGTTIRMMATGAEADVVEVGYFGAGQFIPCDELEAGMVGYITASLKNVKETRVGDTITEAKRPCDAPLPGYKKVNPMVYCGLYPTDGAKYPDLRDALEKLPPNEAVPRNHSGNQSPMQWKSPVQTVRLHHLEEIGRAHV